jgi:hypothetical protein
VGENGVKVLDFGLAKIEPAPSPQGATETMPVTSEGSVAHKRELYFAGANDEGG